MPVLVCISQKEERKGNQREYKTRLLVLDKRTGKSLLRNDEIPHRLTRPPAIRVEHGTSPSVEIDFHQSTVARLEFTNQPTPPEPVALAEVEGVSRKASSGLWGLGRRLGNALGGSSDQGSFDD